jgi:glycosyl transferase family 87
VKRAALLGAALAVLAVVVATGVYALKASRKMPDFEVYWRAGQRAGHAEPLYTLDDGHYQLKYLPAFAMLAVPVGWLPLHVAKALWFAISIGALGAFVAMSLALLPDRRKRAWVLAALVVLAMAKFYGHELVLGQVNLLLGAIVVAAVHLLIRKQEIPAGVLIALAVIVKPYAVIFLPWLAVVRGWRALFTAVPALLAAMLLPATVYGAWETWTLHRDWWHTVSASTAPNLLNADNVSLAAMFAKWLGTGAVAAWLALLTSAALLAVTGDVIRRRRTVRAPLALEAAMLLTLMPLLSPQGWDYVFLLATPAVAFLVNYEDRLPRTLRIAATIALATAAFSLFDIMGRRAYGTFMSLSIMTICFLVVIGALHALRLRRLA